MRIVRGIGGALLWIVASLVGLVAVVLCVTVILLPVGIPLLALSRRMFGTAVRLMLPPEVAHPVDEIGKSLRRRGRKVKAGTTASTENLAKRTGKRLRKQKRRTRKRLHSLS